MAFRRYVALIRAWKGTPLLDSAADALGREGGAAGGAAGAAQANAKARRRRMKPWSPLDKIPLPHRTAVDGSHTLDSSLDHAAYQLFRDGLLRLRRDDAKKGEASAETGQGATTTTEEVLFDVEDQFFHDMSKNGLFPLRRSISSTAIVIGCDEAGRGPLAGPLVGAAVCRVPIAAMTERSSDLGRSQMVGGNAEFETLEEPFGVYDSKGMSQGQRAANFKHLTGASDVVSLASSLYPEDIIAETICCKSLPAPQPSVTFVEPLQPLQETAVAPPCIEDLLSSDPLHDRKGRCVTLRGTHKDNLYHYYWSITAVNHTYVDKENVFAASMSCMHKSAVQVWRLLAAASKEEAGRATSPAAVLCRKMKHLSATTDQAEHTSLPEDCRTGSTGEMEHSLFGVEERQPPLVLFDGSHFPEASREYFCDIEVAGDVHAVVKGDRRSWAIAAASNLAKVTRDTLMDVLHQRYPHYGFNRHHGYPVAEHFKCLRKWGLTHAHRLSYKPCADIAGIERQQRRKPEPKEKKPIKAAAGAKSASKRAWKPKKPTPAPKLVRSKATKPSKGSPKRKVK